MVQTQTKTKKWGNSIGIVLPKSLVEEANIKPNETIVIEIKKVHKAKEFFGLLSNWNKSEQEIKDELKKGW